jgi:hypothetical protein
MNPQTFERACALADQRQHLIMSTTDRSGVPHMASVGGFDSLASDKIALSDWHCPATLVNLQYNNQVSLIVWDIVTDTGYQFVGQVEAIRTFNPSSDPELVVRVNQVLNFNHRGHTDLDLEEGTGLNTGDGVETVTGTHQLHMDSQRRRAYLYVRRSLGA